MLCAVSVYSTCLSVHRSPCTVQCVLLCIFCCSDFAEKLLKRLERSKEKFEVKLLLMNLISKLIGVHQVCAVLIGCYQNIYSFLSACFFVLVILCILHMHVSVLHLYTQYTVHILEFFCKSKFVN